MKETITYQIEKSVGYERSRQQAWIARIIGTSRTYIFDRVFEATEAEDKEEMFTARRKGRGSWSESAAVEIGLYEIVDADGRRYRVVWRRGEGEDVVSMHVDEARAIRMAVLMDAGMSSEEARVATKKTKDAAPVAAPVAK